MGNKVAAREAMERAGLPLLPGARGKLADAAEAVAVAEKVGFPVILKASAGGGGRGMRIVYSEGEIASQFGTAHEEAEKAFGDGSIYLEKYLVEPRHIEFQVFGDHHGKVIQLGERECSIQRRHQKLIEEAPSPDAPAFTDVGSRVKKGQVLCIIEAMKLMNEIESDADGVVLKIFPQNAQAVEYGEPLFAIKAD